MKSFFGYCQNLIHNDDNGIDSLKLYFNGLSDTMKQIKSMLAKSNTNHTEVSEMHINMNKLQKLLTNSNYYSLSLTLFIFNIPIMNLIFFPIAYYYPFIFQVKI